MRSNYKGKIIPEITLLKRWITLSSIIRIAFLLALGSVLIIELLLKRWEAPNLFFLQFGDIYLKICYSLLAATIFYFINQHLPKEERKIRSYRFVNNKVMAIHKQIDFILVAIEIGDKINVDTTSGADMKAWCKTASGKKPKLNSLESDIEFKDWRDYFISKSNIVCDDVDDLLMLSDSLTSNLIEKLLIIKDIFHERINFVMRYEKNNIENLANSLLELYRAKQSLLDEIHSVYRIYSYEHGKRYKELNRIKKG